MTAIFFILALLVTIVQVMTRGPDSLNKRRRRR